MLNKEKIAKLILIFAVVNVAVAQVYGGVPSNIAEAKKSYNYKLYNIQSKAFESSLSLNNSYKIGLSNLKKKYQKNGDLDSWKSVNEEYQRFEQIHAVSANTAGVSFYMYNTNRSYINAQSGTWYDIYKNGEKKFRMRVFLLPGEFKGVVEYEPYTDSE